MTWKKHLQLSISILWNLNNKIPLFFFDKKRKKRNNASKTLSYNFLYYRQARLARIRGSYAEPEPDSEEDQQHKSIVEQHHSRIFDKKVGFADFKQRGSFYNHFRRVRRKKNKSSFFSGTPRLLVAGPLKKNFYFLRLPFALISAIHCFIML